MYILQQDFDDSYFEETHGVNKDSVVVYKASDADADEEYGYKLDEGTLPDGETDVNYFYRDLMNFFAKHKNLKNDADYEAFCKLVDPQSVLRRYGSTINGTGRARIGQCGAQQPWILIMHTLMEDSVFVYMTWILADVVDQERHTQIQSAMTITIRT